MTTSVAPEGAGCGAAVPALAGVVLISAPIVSFLNGVGHNPAVPPDLAAAKPQVGLAGGIPFMSGSDLTAGVAPKTAGAIVAESADARINGCAPYCRSSPSSVSTPPGVRSR